MEKKYGQADYLYAVMRQTLEKLFERGIITAEQKERIDYLNKQAVFDKFPSIAELEVAQC